MQRPRRTINLPETPATPSTRKEVSRQSRIALSITRNTCKGRSSSAEPGINAVTAAPQSTIKKRERSSSVTNSRTPQRTPLRHQSPNPFTSRPVTMTGEKQRALMMDKKWIQEQLTRITEHLKDVLSSVVIPGLSVEFFSRGGTLRSMSTKQFIAILNYFLNIYAEKRFLVGANHVESISKILTQIEYPYPVNKSWLKTPTAPHAIGNVVLLFSYFMDFISSPGAIDQFRNEHLICAEMFPDVDFAIKSMQKAEVGFDIWNKQEDEEFEKLKGEIVDEFIQRKTTLAGAKDLDKEIKKLNRDLDKLMKQTPAKKDDSEYHHLDKKLKTILRKTSAIEKEIQANQKDLKLLSDQINVKKAEIMKFERSIVDLKESLQNQEISIKERDQIIEENHQLQGILTAQRNTVAELQNDEFQQQIQLARLMKRMTEQISEFNKYIGHILTELHHHLKDENTEWLHLQRDSTDENLANHIDRITVYLNKLKNTIIENNAQLVKEIDFMTKQINLNLYKIKKHLDPNTNIVQQSIKEIENEMAIIERELIDLEHTITPLDIKLDEFVKKSVNLKNSIELNEKEILRKKAENESIMCMAEAKFEHLNKQRHRQAERDLETIRKLDKSIDELNENVVQTTAARTKMLMEGVQRIDETINELLADYAKDDEKQNVEKN